MPAKPTEKPKIGTRKDVWTGKAEQTTGGLTKRDLCLNTSGRVVSRKRSEYARKVFEENEGLRQQFRDGAAPPINHPKAKSKPSKRLIEESSQSDDDSSVEVDMKPAKSRTKTTVSAKTTTALRQAKPPAEKAASVRQRLIPKK
jgi:hypothetical protein